jgi:hypothetical protein
MEQVRREREREQWGRVYQVVRVADVGAHLLVVAVRQLADGVGVLRPRLSEGRKDLPTTNGMRLVSTKT